MITVEVIGDDEMTVKIRQNLVSSSKYSLKCPNPMVAEFITVHNTANDASADNEIRFMISNNSATSYHFAIDDKEVVQGLPLNRNGWHSGDGNGPGNRRSIGVEICYSRSGGARWEGAKRNAVRFLAQLLRERKWGVDKLRQHADWSNKNCPHRTRAEGWKEFVELVRRELSSSGNEVAPKPQKPKPNPAPTPTPPKNIYRGTSIVDYLKSIRVDSSMTNRRRLAAQHGIQNYSGTAVQNTLLLRKMRGF